MSQVFTVVFDMDGVVVDTVGHLYKAYLDILTSFGAVGNREEFECLNGARLSEIVSTLVFNHGLAGQEEALRDHFSNRFECLYEDVDLVDGVTDLLAQLRERGMSICLASSAQRKHIDFVLSKFNLRAYFDVIVSGDDVAQAKPNPEIYNLVKNQCKSDVYLVIEDSINGLASAWFAGMVPIYYCPDRVIENNYASYMVSSMALVIPSVLDQQAMIVQRSSRLTIIDSNEEKIPLALSEEVENTWQRALLENPRLFNDDVTMYKSHQVSASGCIEVDVESIEYKHVLHSLLSSGTKNRVPLGVSGIVVDANGDMLIGKRSHCVTEYRSCYEFIPSGGLPANKFGSSAHLDQILVELYEESNVGPDDVGSVHTLGLILDVNNGVMDIAALVTLKSTLTIGPSRNAEYDDINFLTADEVEELIRLNQVVPSVQVLLNLLSTRRRQLVSDTI